MHGQDVDVDELGRVRLRFPWDRRAVRDDSRGHRVRVSHLWAGAGFGFIDSPRIGQEVLVDFVQGNPEQPVVVGRLFNRLQHVVEKLPDHATRSAWRSNSSPGSNGFNELMMEDRTGNELMRWRAETDLRRLVKHDEVATVGRDRQWVVGAADLEQTDGKRTQVAHRDRVESTNGDRTTVIRGTRKDLVAETLTERLEVDEVSTVIGDRHELTRGEKRERVEFHHHGTIGRSREEAVGRASSLTVGHAYEEALGSYSVTTGEPDGWIHLVAAKQGGVIVIEVDVDVTFEGAGGFIKIDPAGVTIVGAEVVINEGGSPGSLPGPGTTLPEPPDVAVVPVPVVPAVAAAGREPGETS